uniref:Transposase n=1 Tax=Steinernema glaseri TaxID=37863 RepID=A0A1I7Z3W2_9BILA
MRLSLLLLLLVALVAAYVDIDDLDRLFHKDSLTLHQDGTGEYSGGPAMKSLIRRYGPVRYRKKSPANIYVFNTHEYSGAG